MLTFFCQRVFVYLMLCLFISMNFSSKLWFHEIGTGQLIPGGQRVMKEGMFADRFLHNIGLFQGHNRRKIRSDLETED
jgi:hypothetical protein